ncbi:MAG: DUF4139 domain-containing protein, partial [Deltaproteobacteria bacterium]|nr:DUF4139 domain-containing protein [Deltaproteobacteria bacterium]
ALLEAIVSIQTEIARKNAAVKTRKARLSLWENIDSSDEKFTPDDIVKLDNAFSERLADMYAAESKDERDLEELRQRMEKAEKALHEFDAEYIRPVAVIPYAGPRDKTVLVRYSYIMPGSSHTAYRLTAYPEKSLLRVEQDVTLFQNSGASWTDVAVYVSTTRRDTAVRPAPLTPWRIALIAKDAPVPAPGMRMSAESSVQMAQVNLQELNVRSGVPAAPSQAEMGTFRLWSLGKKTLDNAVAVTLPLAKDEYKAEYRYTIYPSVNPKGFLTAALDLDRSLELPQGMARLFVDDVAIGQQPMSINGNKATLYFGTDPLVTATMRDVKRTTGEKGFISKEQNMLWHWEILVRNSRGRAVDVWVEDPQPDEQDSAINVTVESTPKPEKATAAAQLGATKIFRWKFTMQPNETRKIEHKVAVSAPADKTLRSLRNR